MQIDFEKYKELEQAMGITDYSNEIIHYTSTETLMKIIDGNQLWFGNIKEMNDTSECKYYLNNINNILYRYNKEIKSHNLQEIINKTIKLAFEGTYISSWCEYNENQKDSLPMWQSYGDDGNGVGIIVDSSNFQPSRLNSKKLNFFITNTKVKYSTTDQSIQYAENLADCIQGVFFDRPKIEQLFTTILSLIIAAPTIIHPSFSHEKEIRFLSMNPIPSIRNMRGPVELESIYLSKNYRNFATLNLEHYSEYDFDLRIPSIFKKVIIGPSAKQTENSMKLREALSRRGYNDIEVLLSEIPYRSKIT